MIRALLVLAVLCLPFLAEATSSVTAQQVPRWLNSPENQYASGFIGTAAKFSAGKNGSVIAARRRALNSLLQYHHIDTAKVDNKQLLAGKVQLTDGRIIKYLSEYRSRDTLFSYAYIENSELSEEQFKALTAVTPLKRCEFNQCSPKWLCESDTSKVVGVSNLSSKPSKQFELSQQVASDIFNRTHKTKVHYQAKIYASQTKASTGKETLRDVSKFSTMSHRQLVLKPVNLCWSDSFLYTEFQTPQTEQEKTQLKAFSQWLSNPTFGDKVGVVGIFDGYESTGKLSNKIDLAIRSGLVELAKSENIKIDHRQMSLQNQAGHYFIATTDMQSDAVVSARLLDVNIMEKDNKLVIYTWLIPLKETKNET